eukprot:scaffold6423_cov33-Tisochrysis_lutea.AAC.1
MGHPWGTPLLATLKGALLSPLVLMQGVGFVSTLVSAPVNALVPLKLLSELDMSNAFSPSPGREGEGAPQGHPFHPGMKYGPRSR